MNLRFFYRLFTGRRRRIEPAPQPVIKEFAAADPRFEHRVIDVEGAPLPSIVGKPYEPGNQVDLWINRTA